MTVKSNGLSLSIHVEIHNTDIAMRHRFRLFNIYISAG